MEKILLLISHATGSDGNRGVGGPEVRYREFLKNRNDTGISYVAAYSPDGTLWDDISNIDGVLLIPLDVKGAKDFMAPFRILKIIKETGSKAAHSQGPVTLDFFTSVACLMAGIPYLVTRPSLISDYLMPGWKKWAYKIFDRVTVSIAKKVVAVSENGLRELKSEYVAENKLVKITNGVDIGRFNINEKKTTDTVVFGTVAQFTYGKGQDMFIRSFARAKEKTTVEMRGMLVGSGPFLSEMKELASSLGVLDDLEFTGFEKDIPGKLVLMDALYLLSYREGLPVSLIEGCAAGLPVVGTDVGGISEIVKDGLNGFLVPVEDIESGSSIMVKLAEDIKLREDMGRYSRNLAEKNFSLQRMITEYERNYAWLISQE
jgi:glycosyltransferase involved in cell wall biosynthesis